MAPSRRSLLRLAAAAGLALAAALAGGGVATAQGTLPIGVAGPMTGTYEGFGQQLRTGAAFAVERINRAGGVLGKRLVLTVLDDQCDPGLAVEAAKRAAKLSLRFVAGHFCSGSSIPASEVYRAKKILMITPASTNPLLTEQGNPYVFRVVGRDDAQARFAADWVLGRLPGHRIAVVDDGSAYGSGLADTFATRLRRKGVAPVARLDLAPGAAAYPEVIQRLRQARAQVLYYGGYDAEAAALLRSARAVGLKLRLVGGDTLSDPDFWQAARWAGQGTLFSFVRDPREHPAARRVVAAFRARGIEPEGYILYAYAAVEAWAEAARRAGQATAPAVATELRQGAYPTVLGRLAFDAKGDRRGQNFVMYRWQNGSYAPAAD